MKMVKMFTSREVEKGANIENLVCLMFEDGMNVCNDVAVRWYITKPEKEEYSDFVNKINEFLLKNDCKVGETIYIDVTW